MLFPDKHLLSFNLTDAVYIIEERGIEIRLYIICGTLSAFDQSPAAATKISVMRPLLDDIFGIYASYMFVLTSK